jgi:hypothetical protein
VSHKGVEGNEKSDEEAKAAALGEQQGVKAVAKRYRGRSQARIQREVTESKWTETDAWWTAKYNNKGIYRMNKKRKMPVELSLAKKSIASGPQQVNMGHALMTVYFKRIKKNESQECWWCQYKRQTRDYLFKWYNKWKR